MKHLAEEINYLSLSDTRLLGMHISLEDYVRKIVLTIDLQSHSNEIVQLHFEKVHKYSFYNTNDCELYYIVDYKFIIADNMYYIPLDPVDISGSPNEEDNDYIFAEKVSITYSNIVK